MISETNRLAGLASQMSNERQHVIFSTMVGVNNVLENGDYNPKRHQGKTLEVLVKQLSSLSAQSNKKQAGTPKGKKLQCIWTTNKTPPRLDKEYRE